MFKSNSTLPAVQRAFMFSGYDYRKNILAVGAKGQTYVVDKKRFSVKGKGLYMNRITGTLVFCTTSGSGDYDLIFKD